MSGHRARRQPVRPGRAGQGFALVVVLMLVAVIALGATASLRLAMRSQQAAQGNEQQVLALEAARLALRYCERAVLAQPAAIEPLPAPDNPADAAWRQFDSWEGESATAESVPEDWITDTDTADGAGDSGTDAGSAVAPQCLAQWGADPAAGVRWLTITARGVSPDFQTDDQGSALQGAQRWLQTSLLLAPMPETAESAGSPCAAPCAYAVIDRVWTALADPPQP